MGGGQSSARPPPSIVEEPYPLSNAIEGVSISSALSCGSCTLSVPKGVSTSSVKIFRESGMVTNEECAKFSEDYLRVTRKEMAFREFKKKLQAGVYLRGI